VEIVLQWVDEAEDLFFAAVFLWSSTRRLCLEFGLLAALILEASKWWTQLVVYTPVLAAVAGASVAVWLLGLLTTRLLHGGRASPEATA
jgi:hypothetical protein